MMQIAACLVAAFALRPVHHVMVVPTSATAPRRHAAVRAEATDEGPNPEEWRAFRAKLISGGLKVTGEEDGGKEVKVESAPESNQEREPVAPANEELLKKQNEALYQEYLSGAWAHAAPEPEAGGLVVRLPLQAQLVHEMRTDAGEFGGVLRERLIASLPTADATDAAETDRLLEQWSSNTVYTYRLADRLITEMLESVMSKSQNGKVSLGALSPDQQAIVKLYSDAQDSWQEVALITHVDADADDADEPLGGSSSRRYARESLVINRPLAKSMSTELAQLLLNGDSNARPSGVPPLHSERFVERFVSAFGSQCAVYLGGPDEQGAIGRCIHGYELEGATELCPGTRIFTGGVEAIVDAVERGERSPLDFRWFVGVRKDICTDDGSWHPVACARPVALKQCLGLPKPLWHEVLELCGGELAELSRIELLKRDDLQ